jgi:hypothetical protein
VEDRIREGKAAGLRNFPCRGWEENNAWLEAVLAAADLVCWAKLICFAHVPRFHRHRLAPACPPAAIPPVQDTAPGPAATARGAFPPTATSPAQIQDQIRRQGGSSPAA